VANEKNDEVAALAAAMPRALIESGRSGPIAEDWISRTRAATSDGCVELPRYPLDPGLRDGLFEVRRARRVVRGLEAAAEALDREAAGLSRAAATRSAGRRISRLLVLSNDGAPRFYRQAMRIVEQHVERAAAIVVDADEADFGDAVFGGGRRVRAILLDHKDAVVYLLDRLVPPAEAPPDVSC